MEGRILDYSIQTNSGVITGDDGNRYTFAGADWNESASPTRGMRVDFQTEGDNAVSIYRALGASGSGEGTDIANILGGEKNKLVAGLLGIFLGWVGVHKFYLGFQKPARIQAIIGGGSFGLAIVIGIILTPIIAAATGYSQIGFLAVLGTLGTLCYLVTLGMGVIGVVEGVLYLTKSDEDFEQIYVSGQKQWF